MKKLIFCLYLLFVGSNIQSSLYDCSNSSAIRTAYKHLTENCDNFIESAEAYRKTPAYRAEGDLGPIHMCAMSILCPLKEDISNIEKIWDGKEKNIAMQECLEKWGQYFPYKNTSFIVPVGIRLSQETSKVMAGVPTPNRKTPRFHKPDGTYSYLPPK